MNFKVKDYVFAKWDGEENAHKPPLLYRIVAIKPPGKLECRLEKDPHQVRGTETVSASRVIANLGPSPHPGKVYNHDLSARYRKTVDTDYVPLHLYCSITKKRLSEMTTAFNRVGRRLEKLGLAGIFSRNIDYYLKPKRGRWAGWFQASKHPDKKPHQMVFGVDAEVISLDYLYLHEIAHAFHFECLLDTPEILVKWQRLYNKTVMPTSVPKADASKLLTRWQRSQNDSVFTLSDLSRAFEEDEEKRQLQAIVHWIRQNRGVKPKELNLLMAQGDTEEIQRLWPTRTISAKRELKPVISEYACSAVEETIAESIAMHLLKVKLPKEVIALTNNTLSLIKAELRN